MKSATNSPCRFSGLKARASRVFGGLFGSKKLGARAFILVLVACLGVSAVAPMAEDVAADEGELTCFVIKYKQEGASEAKGTSICGRVLDGKIVSEFTAGKTELSTEVLALMSYKQLHTNASPSPTKTDYDYYVVPYYTTTQNNAAQNGNGSTTVNKCLDGTSFGLDVPCSAESFQAEYQLDGNSSLENIQRQLNGVGVADNARPEATITVDGENQKWVYQGIEVLTGNSAESWADVDSESDDACRAATGLAWILCPAIEMLKDATTGLYNNTIKQFLQIDAGIFSDSNSAVYQAWQIFQNFANIGLVIIILFIVFSQLTGIGIDNYGIKKSLPKLIVAVVLINLSYFLAQLCVDLANILGYSLQALFDGLASGVNLTTNGADVGYGAALATGIAIGSGTGAAVVGGAAAIITALESWPLVGLTALAAIPTVIAALFAALIAVAFFFILLAARQAGVILFVAIAPLAILCNILPNTQGIFKKWLKIFEALLLVYPICGLLMGAGGFASVVLLSVMGGGSWASLVALLTSVVPFFFIPTVLKSSMAGLGNLGAKISGFGSRMGQKTRALGAKGSGAIKKNDKYQAALGHAKSDVSRAQMNRINKKRNKIAQKNFGMNYDQLSDSNKAIVDDGISAADKIRMGQWGAGIAKDEKEMAAGMAILNGEKGIAGFMDATRKQAQYEAGKNDDALRNWDKEYYTEDAEDISFKEGDKEHRFRKYADGKIDYLNEQREASNDEKKELKKRIDSGQATKSKTKLQFVKKGQDWVTADGKSIKRYSQDQIDQKVAAGQGVMTSYGETKQIEAETANDQELGKMAGFAGMTEGEVVDLGHKKMTAAATETEISNQQAVVNGQGNVLNVRRNEAQTAVNQTIGKAQATQKLNAHGYSTVGSVQAAQNAAEGQLINTITQNVAAPSTQMNATQIGEAVATGTTSLRNQFESTTATNNVGVTQIDSTYAKSLAQQRKDATDQKMYAEGFKLQPRGESVNNLKLALAGDPGVPNDYNYVLAAFDDIASKGGYEDAMKAIKDMEESGTTLDPGVMEKVYDKMGTMSEPAMKQYGKYRNAMKNLGATSADIGTFSQWLAGTANSMFGGVSIGADKASFGGYMASNKDNALLNATKDAFGLYNEAKDRSIGGHIYDDLTEKQILSGILSVQDNDARKAGEKLLINKLHGQLPSVRGKTLASLNNSQLARLQPSTLAAILNVPKVDGTAPLPAGYGATMSALKIAINDPNNSSVFSGLDTDVRDFINRFP